MKIIPAICFQREIRLFLWSFCVLDSFLKVKFILLLLFSRLVVFDSATPWTYPTVGRFNFSIENTEASSL